MAARAHYDDAEQVRLRNRSDTNDSGYDTEPIMPTTSNRSEDGRRIAMIGSPQAIPVTVSAARNRVQQLTTETVANRAMAPAPFQRFPVDLTTVVASAQYNVLHRDIQQVLNRPEISIDQQRILCSLFDATTALRQELRAPVPDDFFSSLVTSRSPTFLVGPRRRPLSTAAITQNVRARIRRSYGAALAADNIHLQAPQTQSRYPPRYGHAYDEMLGTTIGEDDEKDDADEEPAPFFSERYARSRSVNREYYFGPNKGKGHSYTATEDRHLIEVRQARALGGLATRSLDEEIERRISQNNCAWGCLGRLWILNCVRWKPKRDVE